MLTRVDRPAVEDAEPTGPPGPPGPTGPTGPPGPTLTGTAVLVGALVCVAVIVIGVIQMTAPPPERFDVPSTDPRSATSPRTSSESADPKAPPPWDPYAEVDDGGRAAGDSARDQWEPLVEQFVDRFLGPTPARGWIRGLAPVVTDPLLERLRYVSSDEVPEGRFEALTVDGSGDHSVDVTVEVAGESGSWLLGVRVVDLPHDGVGWRVYGYEHRGVPRR